MFSLENLFMPENSSMKTDDTGVWPEAILGKMGEGLITIDKIAAKRFSRPAEAEEAATFVLDKLSENGWKRCVNYKGNAQPQTYLVRLTQNLLEDFSRKKYGRPRPPTWLQESGNTWVQLWTELCKEGRSQQELILRFVQRGHEHDWIKGTIKVIKARIPNCGQKVFEAESYDSITSNINPYNDEGDTDGGSHTSYGHGDYVSTVENNFIEAHKETSYVQQGMAEDELLQMVYCIADVMPNADMFDDKNIASLNSSPIQKSVALANLGQALMFKDLERTVLKMRFKDGLSTSAVAKALQLKAYNVTKIETACLKRIRDAAIAVGLDFESLLGQLK